MSGRPGYEELVTEYGREIADGIIDSAETCSDNAHVDWARALAWAKDRHDNPDPPELVAQQEINNRAHDELRARRGDQANPILYLQRELSGDPYDYPERLALAERIFDAQGHKLGTNWRMGDAMRWAREEAEPFRPSGS